MFFLNMIQLNLFINKNIVNFILLLYKLMRCFMRKRLLIVFSVLLFLLCLSVVSATDENTNSSIVAQDYDGNEFYVDLGGDDSNSGQLNSPFNSINKAVEVSKSNDNVVIHLGEGTLAVNKNVTFNINGVFYIRTTDSNGVVSLAINLRPGDYIITTIFDGLDIGNKVTVLPTLVTKDLNMKYMDGSNFTAQTLDSQGKALANQTVSFNVNGVFYHRITNEDGIASLRIRLMSGEYIITSYWNNFQTGNTIKISP